MAVLGQVFFELLKTVGVHENNLRNRVLVAHACNPSYSGAREQADHESFVRPYLEKTHSPQKGL
jgi:hypothetical protein